MKRSCGCSAKGVGRAAGYGRFALLLIGPLLVHSVMAQIDAGQVLREITPEMAIPTPERELDFGLPTLTIEDPGGATVELSQVTFEGNTRISDDRLQAQVGDYLSHPQDLAGLHAMVNQVTRYYRDQGYLFARVVLPPQSIEDSNVRLQVIEGRYGSVRTHGHPDVAPGSQRFLSDLRPGDVVESRSLERATLILSDQPGLVIRPVMRPGDEVGTGDLVVEVQRDQRVSGSLGLDNFGNRFTGEHRARAVVQSGSIFLTGDDASVSLVYSEDDLVFGSIRYEVPIGGGGLRAFGAFGYSDYELGKEFSVLEVTGRALVYEAGVSYPWMRSQQTNVSFEASYERKELKDSQLSLSSDSKTTNGLPFLMRFDHRDDLGSSGISYGAIGFKLGRLSLNGAQDPGNTEGSYWVLTYDLNRLQRLPWNFTLSARLSGQHTDDNVDSSEGFALSGPNAVRAYPVGEAFGDRGWVGQVELRYNYGDFTPFLFYDQGGITVNASDFDGASNSRQLAGAGLGLRYQHEAWGLDVTAARRTKGGKPESVSSPDSVTFWAGLRYKF